MYGVRTCIVPINLAVLGLVLNMQPEAMIFSPLPSVKDGPTTPHRVRFLPCS
jgi:hypothetical protein